MFILHKRLFFLCILAVLLFCLLTQAEAAGIPYMNKAKIRIAVSPGEQGYGEIIMENPDETPRVMHLYLEDWHYLSPFDGTKEFAPAGTTQRSCASWITFSPAEFALAPFGKQRITYVVKVPKDATGGYYASLFSETLFGKAVTPDGKEQEMSVGIDLKIRVATLFYIEAAGRVNRKVVIDNLKVTNDISSGRFSAKVDFANTGNVDITAEGKFHIMDENSVVYGRGEFNDVYTLPGDKAELSASWKKPLSEGKYTLVTTFDLGKALEDTGFGRGPVMTQEAEIEIGPDGEALKAGQLQ